jgi:hypothetical protein
VWFTGCLKAEATHRGAPDGIFDVVVGFDWGSSWWGSRRLF